MENFTPWQSLAGGIVIGLSASLLLLVNGRICGVSGIFGGLVLPKPGETAWRASFVLGLLAGGLALSAVAPETLSIGVSRSAAAIVAGGLLVGIGTRMGNGCTSGHGICGLPRLSPRSFLATLVFMATGVGAAVAVHLLGGRL